MTTVSSFHDFSAWDKEKKELNAWTN